MNLKKTTLLVLVVLMNISVFAQSKKVADRYFDEFSYIQAAKIYKDLVLVKGDSSKHVLSRLAESYYNNSETEEAEIWYKKLIDNYATEIDLNDLFKYAQTLRSNGKYKKSDSIFLKLSVNQNVSFNEDLKEQGYLNEFNTQKKRIGVRNLAINTPYSDFGGFLHNGKSYYASSVPVGDRRQKIYKWNNQPFLNIYKADESLQQLEESEKDTVLVLSNTKTLGEPLTSDLHESSLIITKDGKTAYFTRNNSNGNKAKKSKNNTSNLKIYKASFVNGYWVNVKELPFNSAEYSVGHPALSPDEKTLYFASNMPGGFGETDIYKVDILGKDEYGTPVNLGNTINTIEKEVFPFVGEDNVLYFSSTGHLGLGLLDIFQSKITSDGNFTKPENLAYPFNSKKDDFSFFISNDGKRGFFSSNRDNGKGDDDIYSFYIYTDAPCTQIVEGKVISNKTNKPIKSAVVKIFNKNKELVAEVISDDFGNFRLPNIPCNNDYTITADKLDHRSDKSSVSTTDIRNHVVKTNLKLIPLIIGDQIVINPIYFDFDKSFIRDDAQYELEHIVTVMKNHPELVIKIESHTDSRGKKSYNKQLSDRRAKSTRDFIISRGIASNRIESAIGYGEEQPLNKCVDGVKCSEEEHQLNRRSYFYIVKGGESIKVRQEAEVKRIKERINSSKKNKNRFLEYLKGNQKSDQSSVKKHKCYEEDEDCEEKHKENKTIDYKK